MVHQPLRSNVISLQQRKQKQRDVTILPAKRHHSPETSFVLASASEISPFKRVKQQSPERKEKITERELSPERDQSLDCEELPSEADDSETEEPTLEETAEICADLFISKWWSSIAVSAKWPRNLVSAMIVIKEAIEEFDRGLEDEAAEIDEEGYASEIAMEKSTDENKLTDGFVPCPVNDDLYDLDRLIDDVDMNEKMPLDCDHNVGMCGMPFGQLCWDMIIMTEMTWEKENFDDSPMSEEHQRFERMKSARDNRKNHPFSLFDAWQYPWVKMGLMKEPLLPVNPPKLPTASTTHTDSKNQLVFPEPYRHVPEGDDFLPYADFPQYLSIPKPIPPPVSMEAIRAQIAETAVLRAESAEAEMLRAETAPMEVLRACSRQSTVAMDSEVGTSLESSCPEERLIVEEYLPNNCHEANIEFDGPAPYYRPTPAQILFMGESADVVVDPQSSNGDRVADDEVDLVVADGVPGVLPQGVVLSHDVSNLGRESAFDPIEIDTGVEQLSGADDLVELVNVDDDGLPHFEGEHAKAALLIWLGYRAFTLLSAMYSGESPPNHLLSTFFPEHDTEFGDQLDVAHKCQYRLLAMHANAQIAVLQTTSACRLCKFLSNRRDEANVSYNLPSNESDELVGPPITFATVRVGDVLGMRSVIHDFETYGRPVVLTHRCVLLAKQPARSTRLHDTSLITLLFVDSGRVTTCQWQDVCLRRLYRSKVAIPPLAMPVLVDGTNSEWTTHQFMGTAPRGTLKATVKYMSKTEDDRFRYGIPTVDIEDIVEG